MAVQLSSFSFVNNNNNKSTTIVAGYLAFLGNQAGKYYPSMFIFLIGEEVNNECFEAAELFAISMLCVKPS
jgi:hypothetical protein